jgi:hypothetical protein
MRPRTLLILVEKIPGTVHFELPKAFPPATAPGVCGQGTHRLYRLALAVCVGKAHERLMIPGQGGTRHGRILRLVAILAVVAQVSRVRCEDDGHYFGDGGADDGRCLRLAPGHRLMHEFGAERAHVEVVIGGQGCPAAGMIAAELHGDVFFRHNFGAGHESSSSPSAAAAAPAPISISVVMPMGLEVGAHEAIIILLDGDTSEELDSLAYTFFTSDWRPAMRWMFPPDGYTFGRNSQRFLRFKVQDEGGQERCQEGAMSCARWSPMEYHVNYTLNGVLQADNIRQIYMISMASLQDGKHTGISPRPHTNSIPSFCAPQPLPLPFPLPLPLLLPLSLSLPLLHPSTLPHTLSQPSTSSTASVAISDANKQPTGLNMTVTFTIDDSFEYTDDGEAPEYKAPCPDQVSLQTFRHTRTHTSTGFSNLPKIKTMDAGNLVCIA